MSVAECVLASGLAIMALAGVHELFRLQLVENSIRTVAHAHAARLAYSGLNHILQGTFLASNAKSDVKNNEERRIAAHVQRVMGSPVLSWTWLASHEDSGSLKGVRVWLDGAHFENLTAATDVRIHICIGSWLAPLMKVISDDRNCLGQFKDDSQQMGSRGVGISVRVSRMSTVAISPFFTGKSIINGIEQQDNAK